MVSLQGIGALLVLTGTLAVGACSRPENRQQLLATCPGQGSGGFTDDGEHDLVYAVSQDSAGRQLDAAVVVRASPSWRRRQPLNSRHWLSPQPGSPPRGINGATAGPLWIGHEKATGTIWLDSLPVPLHGDNVLLLEVGADDVPRVAGRARVDSRLPLTPGSCGPPRTREEAVASQQAVWAAVRRASIVRDFLDR